MLDVAPRDHAHGDPHRSVAVAAVIGSLYPVVTVLLARIVLQNVCTGLQIVGVAIALAAVVLTALP